MSFQSQITSEIEMNLMEKLRVVEQLSTAFTFDDLLYNREAFQEINNDLPQKNFYLLQGNQVFGHLACQLEEGIAHSHIGAPFGGFVLSEGLKNEEILFFGLEIERRLKGSGVLELRIHQAPDALSNTKLKSCLSLLGYQQSRSRLYQMISLNGESFVSGLHEMEKRKLKKAQELDLEVEWVEDGQWKKLYDFIIAQRNEKGFEFSLSWALLKDFKNALHDHYRGLILKHEGEIIAGTILIKENNAVVYNFAPAHLAKYKRYSPVVFMTAEIYKWASKSGFNYLNLGTSYLGEEQNENLYSFKEKLGAQPFIARTFQKSLNSY